MNAPWGTIEVDRNLVSDADTAEAVRGFLALQARTAAEQNRPPRRSVHSKGVCARAVFQVLDVAEIYAPALAARLARGIYAFPGSYPATVRFSNSDANVNDDWSPDVRGLAFHAEIPVSGSVVRQDYSLQSASTLFFNDVHALVVFAKVFGAPSQTVALGALPFRDQSIFAQTMSTVSRQRRQPVRPYQQLRYWSAAPFRHGSQDVVKYSARPADANPARALARRNPNALRDELTRHLNEDSIMSTFELGLQLLDPARMTYEGKRREADFWIDNASVEWPEPQAPFHTVARLTLLPRSQCAAEACEAECIDVAVNCLPEHAPVGKLNQVRRHAVGASRSVRLGRTTD